MIRCVQTNFAVSIDYGNVLIVYPNIPIPLLLPARYEMGRPLFNSP